MPVDGRSGIGFTVRSYILINWTLRIIEGKPTDNPRLFHEYRNQQDDRKAIETSNPVCPSPPGAREVSFNYGMTFQRTWFEL
jgi:hypothetical protein